MIIYKKTEELSQGIRRKVKWMGGFFPWLCISMETRKNRRGKIRGHRQKRRQISAAGRRERLKKKLCCLTLAFAFCLFLLAGCASPGAETGEENCLTKEELYKLVDRAVKYGKQTSGLMMDETSAYFFGFAGAAVSSMRLAVERILWLKGEGEDFDALAAGSRYTDWDTIAEINFASPYPYYFEGLIYDIEGKAEEAGRCYGYAASMENFPDKGLNFYELRNTDVSALYALRDELRKKENEIYELWTPDFHGYERSVYNAFPDYMYNVAVQKMDAEDYPFAVDTMRIVLRENPKVESFWGAAVIAALYADEPYQAALWLEEGLKYFPDSENLGMLKKSIEKIASESEEGGEEG